MQVLITAPSPPFPTGEAVSKAERSTQHLDDVHGVVREAIEELLELRQRAGETASKGAAIVPHSDSWYYTGPPAAAA